jgi:hypothetical protein
MKRCRNIETLFTESSPRAYGFKQQAEDEFAYMNSHADAPVLAAREIMENWYRHFPAGARKDLVSRFRSKKQKQHDGAFWELYLHELLRRMGYGIEVHPTVPNSDAHPDFLIYQDGVPLAFVEARLAGLPTDEATAAKRLEGELHDALDRVKSPNFFLHIQELTTTPIRPSFKNLARDVEAWLGTLDPDLPQKYFLSGKQSMSFEWEQKGWYLLLQVVPKDPGHRGKSSGRAVGISKAESQWLDTAGELRCALREKADKYGHLGLPFIIAINYFGMHCDRKDWTDALYGSEAVTLWLGEDGTRFQRPFRANDGFWVRSGAATQRNVSAILAGWYVSPWSMGAHGIEVYEHFSPQCPLDFKGNLPCWHLKTCGEELVLRGGRSSAELLQIPKEWPLEWRSPADIFAR